ncbi:spermidine/putrescine transport system ATP-binding protein [Rhodoligotrophos appendicifer]|uniref:ABC transporter ATP-binding protein n=1 Tax=Rhodoligotrophos appendicifer TaxID=987056 RepID=UPI001186F8F1|nr:ABC transporter ATP-binding protein [Rhodoligotrophos appendicifer]
MSDVAVQLNNVSLAYGSFIAVKDVSLSIPKGSFVTLLGPSGCGKTTILRSIAGLVHPTGGEIIVAGRRINDVPIHKRNIGLVFQNYALFPHKSVFDNIAFGLKYRKVEASVIATKVKRALEMVRLPGVEKKLPSEMSGGQQQRIALARAIVIEPDVLLLDEPLSALDANLREEMRTELKVIQREVGITTIFVTHDQEEALAMSDRIVVMNHGVVEQQGPPEEVYREPASRFVASFLGQSNLLQGHVSESSPEATRVRLDGGPEITAAPIAGAITGQPVTVVIRAQRVKVGVTNGEAVNHIEGKVVTTSYLGGTAAYFINAGGITLQANNAIEERVFREGDAVTVSIAADDCVLLDDAGRRYPRH